MGHVIIQITDQAVPIGLRKEVLRANKWSRRTSSLAPET